MLKQVASIDLQGGVEVLANEQEKLRDQATSGLKWQRYFGQYQKTLLAYLDRKGESSLLDAYEFGRRGLTDNLSLLDLSILHRTALLAILNDRASNLDKEKQLLIFQAAGRFFDEVLSTYEVSRRSNGDVNAMLPRLYDAREKESRRIAHVLHDESAQMLALAFMELDYLIQGLDGQDQVIEKIKQVMEYLESVSEQLRTLSHDLRPLILDQLGLLPALNLMASRYRATTGLQIDICANELSNRASQAVETCMYRVVQEALTNIVRHANASHVEIKLWLEPGRLCCSISDDGIGFNSGQGTLDEDQGIGILGMKERIKSQQGVFTLESRKGKGTVINTEVPL